MPSHTGRSIAADPASTTRTPPSFDSCDFGKLTAEALTLRNAS